MNKPVLDLSREVCHACGNKLVKDLVAEEEHCVHCGCLICNVDFSIPYVIPPKKKE